MIYLDYNATTPVDENVLNAIMPFFSKDFGNASATHMLGLKAAKAVENARENIANRLGADAQEIIFTSGATESVNLAIKGLYEVYGSKKNHIITVSTEHSAVLDTCNYLAAKGAEVDYLSVNKNGLISIAALRAAIKENTLLVAVMYANNETGVVQPIKEIGAIAKEHNIFFFCDATQAIGKLSIDVNDINADMLCFSGHKMYAPKGTGGLYVRRKNPRVNLLAQIHGGKQERGLRSGTLNVPGIVGMAKALQLFSEEENSSIKKLRDKLEAALLKIKGITVNGSVQNRMNNVTNLSFANVTGKRLTAALHKELAVSSGSACSAKSNEPSHVLIAMGLDEEAAKNSIRFSLGRFNTESEIDKAIDIVKNIYLQLKD